MTLAGHFATQGIAIVEHALEPDDIERMAHAFAGLGVAGGARHDCIPDQLLGWLRIHPVLVELACRLAGADSQLVRVIAFDKSPAANWFVPWHQDRAIAVAAKVDAEGYGNWTFKDGLVQVEPPLALLEGMVTLRIHLDDCDEDNGPLEVIPGSHTMGRLTREKIASLADTTPSMLCLAARGDILAMRPLLVHRSQKARVVRHRRVLHLEYASASLAMGLTWALAAAGNA